MNDNQRNDANIIRDILSAFEANANVHSMFFYASHSGFIEARVVNDRGQKLNTDAKSLLGSAAWNSIQMKLCAEHQLSLKKQT